MHFIGKQDEVADIISIADLMLLPSEMESFGLVALEALACGVPTVGSIVGGIPELITNGETGYLSPVGDTDEMADHAIRLLRDERLYTKFWEACLHRTRTQFCNDLITAQYERIYYRVLGIEAHIPQPVCE